MYRDYTVSYWTYNWNFAYFNHGHIFKGKWVCIIPCAGKLVGNKAQAADLLNNIAF